MNLLLVDDVPETREWIAQILVAAFPGVRVTQADGLGSFLQAASRTRPDIVVVDEVLGIGEDTRGVLEEAAKLTQSVILISGVVSGRTGMHVLPPGVLGRIKKPDWDTGRGDLEFVGELRRLLQA